MVVIKIPLKYIIMKNQEIFFRCLAFLVVSIIFTGCDLEAGFEEEEVQSEPGEFIEHNVAFVDARIRSISEEEYVREVVLMNFSDDNNMPPSIIFEGTTFFDNGSFNDLSSSDGIYTSAAIFKHDEEMPYKENMNIKSLMNEVIIDKHFQHKDQLEKAIDEYSKTIKSKAGPSLTITCKVEFGVSGCRADRWGWCDNCCFSYDECEVTYSIF